MAERRDLRLMWLWQVAALAIFVVGSVAVGGGTWAWYVSNRDRNQTQEQAQARQIAGAVGTTLGRYADQSAATAALFSQPGLLDHAAFHTYLQELGIYTRYPGLHGLGFVSWVTGAALPGFVAQARADGVAGFAATPAGSRPTYCVASYVDVGDLTTPFPLMGYDLCTVPTLGSLLDLATTTGRQQAVVESTLATGPAYRGNFILISPVYRGHPATVAERRAQLLGWVAALVDGRQLLATALGPEASHMGVQLYSGVGAAPSQLVVSLPAGAATAASGVLTEHEAAGAAWTLRVRSLPGAPGPANPLVAPGVVFALALLLNLALAGFVWDLGRGRVRAMRSFRDSERRFQSMATSSPVGMLEISDDGTTQYFNPRLQEIAGVGDRFFHSHNFLDCVHPEDRARVAALARSVLTDRRDIAAGFRLLRPAGDVRHVRVLAAPVTTAAPAPGRYVATVQDVSDEVAANEALAFQALHDHLTGLPNRALFLDRLDQELSGAARSGAGLAVMFLDLDRFKVINDGLGHQAGDDLLRVVADRLLHVVRSGETVARLGGDEFTFILHDIATANMAAVVAERVLEALAEPLEVAGREVVVTGSIGIVVPRAGADAVAVLRDADAAMYRAKDAGRARFEIFDEAQRKAVVKRLTIESELRRGIEQGELRLHYQPLVSLVTGDAIGAEALVRWQHPTRGTLEPMEFIPVAEETGLIVALGEWVLRTAAADCVAWDRCPDGPRVEHLAVNVSARQLASPSLCPMLHEALRTGGIDPNRIMVEITESVIMSGDDVTRRSLADLRGLGVGMAIDDFGTGYSSLASLSALPVSVVKIDKSFVDRIGHELDGGPIVVAIVEMAHALGLSVVAEGVSNEDQRHFLARCGCDQAQGYLWSPGLAADDFVSWWQERALRKESSRGAARLVG